MILYRVVFLIVGSMGRAQGEVPGSCKARLLLTDCMDLSKLLTYLSSLSCKEDSCVSHGILKGSCLQLPQVGAASEQGKAWVHINDNTEARNTITLSLTKTSELEYSWLLFGLQLQEEEHSHQDEIQISDRISLQHCLFTGQVEHRKLFCPSLGVSGICKQVK